MKAIVPKKDLAKVARLAVAATEAKSSTPVLASVLIVASGDRLTFTGTDLMVGASASVACKIEKPGSALVTGRQLLAAIGGLADGDVRLELDDKASLVLVAGKSRQRIPTGMAEDFPAIPRAEGIDLVSVPAALLLAAFTEGSVSMSVDESRAHIACALVEIVDGVLRVVSTDGHTLAQRESPFDGSFARVTIPQKSAIDVRRALEAVEGDVQLGTKLGYLFLVADGIEVSVKIGDGDFIPYKQVIPKSKKRRATVPREATLAAIKRVLSNIDDASPTAQLSFSDGSLAIRSSTKDAEASDAVDIDYAGDDFRISANGAYLIRALGAMAHDEAWIDTSSELDPIVIRGRDSTESVHVVMPVRM